MFRGVLPSAIGWYSAGGALGELLEEILKRGAGRGAGFGVGRGGIVWVVADMEVEVSVVEIETGVSLTAAQEEGAPFWEECRFLSRETFPM